MTTHKLKIDFLWQQHQPYYKDSQFGKFIMPWTRLHGIGVKMLFRYHGFSDLVDFYPLKYGI
ncbi:hypothetical protein IT568_04060 [bacterium]|nr:hypothetical protein [bacterium]